MASSTPVSVDMGPAQHSAAPACLTITSLLSLPPTPSARVQREIIPHHCSPSPCPYPCLPHALRALATCLLRASICWSSWSPAALGSSLLPAAERCNICLAPCREEGASPSSSSTAPCSSCPPSSPLSPPAPTTPSPRPPHRHDPSHPPRPVPSRHLLPVPPQRAETAGTEDCIEQITFAMAARLSTPALVAASTGRVRREGDRGGGAGASAHTLPDGSLCTQIRSTT